MLLCSKFHDAAQKLKQINGLIVRVGKACQQAGPILSSEAILPVTLKKQIMYLNNK